MQKNWLDREILTKNPLHRYLYILIDKKRTLKETFSTEDLWVYIQLVILGSGHSSSTTKDLAEEKSKLINSIEAMDTKEQAELEKLIYQFGIDAIMSAVDLSATEFRSSGYDLGILKKNLRISLAQITQAHLRGRLG